MTNREVRIALIQHICTAYRARFFEKLAKHLTRKGYKLTILFGKPQKGLTYSGIIPIPKTFDEFSFDFKVLPKIAYEGRLPRSPFHFKRSFIFFPTLIFEIVRGMYDVIISSSVGDLPNLLPLFVVNKLWLHKGFIVWCGGNLRDNAPKPNDSIVKKIAYTFARFIFKNYDACIAYGPATKRFHIYLGADHKRIFIASNTVDTIFFDEVIRKGRSEMERLRKKLKITGRKSVLYVGVLEPRKKVGNLILAFGRLQESMNDATLLIIGDGPDKRFLRDLCTKERVGNVHFLGKIPYSDIPLYYSICDVFVLPSQGGIAVAEAMACGKPVIITEECNALRSIPNLVEHGVNGFILKAADIDSLAQHMVKVLSNPILAKSMGTKSKQLVAKYFLVEEMLAGFEEAIDYVAKGFSSRR